MNISTGNLASNNDCTTEKMGTEHCDLSKKAAQIDNECLDNEQKVLGAVLTDSVINEKSNEVSVNMIDEKSNEVSVSMTENSVIELPEPPRPCSENTCQTLESSCLQQSTSEQVCLSGDKSEIKCPQNVENEAGEMSDAVTPFVVVEEQTQSVPAQVNSDSVNELLDPPSGDVKENIKNVSGETSDVVTGFVEDHTESVPAQVDTDSVNELLDTLSGDITKNISSKNEPGDKTDVVTGFVEDHTEPVPAQVNTDSVNEPLDTPSGDVTKNISSKNEPGEMSDLVTGYVEDHKQSDPAQVNTDSVNEPLDTASGDVTKNISSKNEPGEMSDAITGLVEDQTQSVPAQVNTNSWKNEILDMPSGDAAKNISSDCSERKSNNPPQLREKHAYKKTSKLSKKYILRSLGSSDRTLRSRTKDDKPKDPEPINTVADVNNDETKTKERKKKKKKKTRKEGINDQFSRIRAQLRYYLNRISYEQNLIDAYSAEGWRGSSMEKLKPEKEIQRAKSEILRRKLKIRDLFQNLDSLCAEGRLPESLFDSEGEIDSEDIFCAKCQTKVLATNNDIILCDGACDRGYHQLCLDPPLLTEDIPPGDESWLCPGCDCKDDCIELVNDLLGTSLSLTDTWERVFPEAATAAGSILDHNLGLPSDDSDDDDYNPDGPDDGPEDVEVEEGGSSSDESEYASASEKLEDSHHEDQYMGLPSEDSEDDDYDPEAPILSDKASEESSSSDFTSDSEDLAATIKDNMSTGQDGDVTSALLGDVKNFKGSSRKNHKKPSIADELSSLQEPGQEDLTPVSGKRNVERLDYQKLYEETYHSDTSDDEDWAATATPSRKKKNSGKMTPVSPNGNASNNSRHTGTNNSPTKTLEGCTESGSRGKKRGSSYKKLGEVAVQNRNDEFKLSSSEKR
ncbi:homeobox KN domain protein [Trifolium pratense]|uniref:Homeobox KN domain protein n=1 Tax=Trifolium pratense TaxID=57577 RepID=A0A2K3PA02_TRIPR|nr:homeobox KN domain protein [Trifolium pratense]